ncbi:MAG TPA: hypothetical protein VK631_10540, partial [Solirubrobacteraceae bacterium]|nr:hypothetical protein [Solirubrobacteraceae bacterium]
EAEVTRLKALQEALGGGAPPARRERTAVSGQGDGGEEAPTGRKAGHGGEDKSFWRSTLQESGIEKPGEAYGLVEATA